MVLLADKCKRPGKVDGQNISHLAPTRKDGSGRANSIGICAELEGKISK
jgi:hypothetical protein